MYKDVATNLEKFVIVYPETVVPKPDEGDYMQTFIIRYFVRRANDEYGHIFEVTESVFNEYDKNPFWICESLIWRISGPADTIYNEDGTIKDKGIIPGNKASLGIASKKLKNISLYLPNLLQFYKA